MRNWESMTKRVRRLEGIQEARTELPLLVERMPNGKYKVVNGAHPLYGKSMSEAELDALLNDGVTVIIDID